MAKLRGRNLEGGSARKQYGVGDPSWGIGAIGGGSPHVSGPGPVVPLHLLLQITA